MSKQCTKLREVGYCIAVPLPQQYDHQLRTDRDIRNALDTHPTVVINAHVTKVSDGDTYHCYHLFEDETEGKLKIRVLGIDTPERKNNLWDGQPLAEEATTALSDMIYQKDVVLEVLGLDKYRRLLGLTYFEDENGLWRCVGLEMLKLGMATVYRSDKKEGTGMECLLDMFEEEARSKGLGVWGREDYEAPREYRARMRRK